MTDARITGISKIFGAPKIASQNERSSTDPTTLHGDGEAFAVQMTRAYRDGVGSFAATRSATIANRGATAPRS
jgi:hypothetical protein